MTLVPSAANANSCGVGVGVKVGVVGGGGLSDMSWLSMCFIICGL